MSELAIYCGRPGCGARLRCVQIGVWLDSGPDAVRAGDVYDCPTCGREVIVGAERRVTMRDDGMLVQRVKFALDTVGTSYVSHQYVVESH